MSREYLLNEAMNAPPYEGGTILTAIVPMRKLRPKFTQQRHTELDSRSRQPDSEPTRYSWASDGRQA